METTSTSPEPKPGELIERLRYYADKYAAESTFGLAIAEIQQLQARVAELERDLEQTERNLFAARAQIVQPFPPLRVSP